MVASCSAPTYVRRAAVCPLPPPPPACKPEQFNVITYDTSSTQKRGATYWRISRVSGADSPEEEFGLVFPSSKLALLIQGYDAGTAGYRAMRMLAVDTTAEAMSSSETVPFLATEVRSGAVMGDASIVRGVAASSGVREVVPLEQPMNVPTFWDGHATTSPDGAWMIYASDRPGGLGGTDLWQARVTSSGYSAPRWCGSVVNTPCDEISPQFSPDGTLLFFSSAGHATVGGYDIFEVAVKRVGDSLVFSSVENIGIPVNTSFDEVFPVQLNATTIYYGSNQPREGAPERRDFDVYVLHSLSNGKPTLTQVKPISVTVPQPKPIERATISGVVINQQTQEPVVGAEVIAREPGTTTVLASTLTDSAGRYSLNVPVDTPVDVSAQSSELFYDGFHVNIPKEKKNDTIIRQAPISLPITYVLRVNFPTSAFDNPYPNTLDSNGLETQQTWQAALDELAANVQSGISKLKRLVLIGHTDDVDSDPSNLKLGKQRVEFIIHELERRGIPKQLMEGRSAGERLKPDKRQGEQSDAWRKRSRRVELVKVMQ